MQNERQYTSRSIEKDNYYRQKIRDLIRFSNRDILKQWFKLIQVFIYGFLSAVIINFIFELTKKSISNGQTTSSALWFQDNLPDWYIIHFQGTLNRFDHLIHTISWFRYWFFITVIICLVILSIKYYKKMRSNIIRITRAEMIFFGLLGFTLLFRVLGYEFEPTYFTGLNSGFSVNLKDIFGNIPLVENYFPINWNFHYSFRDFFLPHIYLFTFYLFVFVILFRSLFLLKSIFALIKNSITSIFRSFRIVKVTQVVTIIGGLYFIVMYLVSLNLIMSNVWISPEFIYFLILTSLFVYFLTVKYQIIFELINNHLVKKIVLFEGQEFSQIRRKIGFISLIAFDALIIFVFFTVYSAFYTLFNSPEYIVIISAAIIILSLLVFWLIFFDLMKWKGWQGINVRAFIILLVGVLIFSIFVGVSAWSKIISDSTLASVFIWSGWIFIILYISFFFQLGSSSVVNKLVQLIDAYSPYIKVQEHPYKLSLVKEIDTDLWEQYSMKMEYILDYISDRLSFPMESNNKIFYLKDGSDFSKNIFLNSLTNQLIRSSHKQLDLMGFLNGKRGKRGLRKNKVHIIEITSQYSGPTEMIDRIYGELNNLMGTRFAKLFRIYLKRSWLTKNTESKENLSFTKKLNNTQIISKLNQRLKKKKMSLVFSVTRIKSPDNVDATSFQLFQKLNRVFVILNNQISKKELLRSNATGFYTISLPTYGYHNLLAVFKWQYRNFIVANKLYEINRKQIEESIQGDGEEDKDDKKLEEAFDLFIKKSIIRGTKLEINKWHSSINGKNDKKIFGYEYRYLEDLAILLGLETKYYSLYETNLSAVKKCTKSIILAILKDNKKWLVVIENCLKDLYGADSECFGEGLDVKGQILDWLTKKYVNADHVIQLGNEIVRYNYFINDKTTSDTSFSRSIDELLARS